MSTLKNYQTLAAMAMIAAQGGGDIFGTGYPIERVVAKDWERKKCKSCRKFDKNNYYKGTCPERRICDPLACACCNYEPRKKK